MFLLVLQLKKDITTFYTIFVCSVRLKAFFDYDKLLLTAIYYFRRLYTTFGGHILLSTVIYIFWRPYTTFDGYILLLGAIYHIGRLYVTFNSYILLLALGCCDFVRIQVFPAISFLCGLNTRLEFNINYLSLIQFSCNSMVSPVNFNLPF